MVRIWLTSLCVIVLSLAGCTINFKAEKLEFDADPITPNAGFSESVYKLESIAVSNRKEISWHLLNLAVVLSR